MVVPTSMYLPFRPAVTAPVPGGSISTASFASTLKLSDTSLAVPAESYASAKTRYRPGVRLATGSVHFLEVESNVAGCGNAVTPLDCRNNWQVICVTESEAGAITSTLKASFVSLAFAGG